MGDLGVDGRIVLRWIFRNWDVGVMDRIELAQDKNRWRALECGNETSGSIKCGKPLDLLKIGYLRKKDSAQD